MHFTLVHVTRARVVNLWDARVRFFENNYAHTIALIEVNFFH